MKASATEMRLASEIERCVDLNIGIPKGPQNAIRVRFTESHRNMKDEVTVKKGTVGLLEVGETTIHGDVTWGRFYPIDAHGNIRGFGIVTWPKFESFYQATCPVIVGKTNRGGGSMRPCACGCPVKTRGGKCAEHKVVA